MKKPTVFVSSTIYDFADLRSSLKYWLKEMGFDAQLSEYNDFHKNLNINSYEACLQAVEASDYFILLIGTRRGGIYPHEDISITRKEYRTAYKLANSGKIKKLIVFIRQNVWDVKEDRKSLHKLLQDITNSEKDVLLDTDKIVNYNSNILHDAKHIIDFIDEVTRKEDASYKKMPNMNWVHIFNSFDDIISTLKVELKVSDDISVQIAEQNIKMAIVHNLQKTIYKNKDGDLIANYLNFKDIWSKLKEIRKNDTDFSMSNIFSLKKEETDRVLKFLMFFSIGLDELSTYMFENVLSSGIFMDFDLENGTPHYNNFCKMIHQYIKEINRLKRSVDEFPIDKRQELFNKINSCQQIQHEFYDFTYWDLVSLSTIYERLINIQNISFYLVECIENHSKDLATPLILNGLIESETPLESDILDLLNAFHQ